VENNTRTNYNRTTEETKTLGKKNRKPLDENDLLIETRLFGSYGISFFFVTVNIAGSALTLGEGL
jgi:hypothetical protein